MNEGRAIEKKSGSMSNEQINPLKTQSSSCARYNVRGNNKKPGGNKGLKSPDAAQMRGGSAIKWKVGKKEPKLGLEEGIGLFASGLRPTSTNPN